MFSLTPGIVGIWGLQADGALDPETGWPTQGWEAGDHAVGVRGPFTSEEELATHFIKGIECN